MSGVVVLGAGLAGLSTSYFLRRAGVPHRVLEKDPVVGGHASTTEEAGYRFDRTGHLLHLRDEEIRQLVLSWFPEGHLLEIHRKSVVYSHGVYTRYPFQANVRGLPSEVAYACVRDFVKASTRPTQMPIESFEDYSVAHFGEAISREFMVPYNQKLWGVHPAEITAKWCDRFVPIPTMDEVLRGAFGVDPPELGYNTKFLYPRLGIGELASALATRAGSIELGREARAIDLEARVVTTNDGELVPFTTLVSTLSMPALVARLVDAPAEVREAAAKLRATHLFYLDVALNTPVEVAWHWAYVPSPDVPFYRVGAYSRFSSALVPVGKGSLYVELASREAPDLATLLPVVADELVKMGVIRAREAIRFARVRRLDPAYVVFDRHHEEATRVVSDYLASRDVLSAGRYARFTYASMEDAILDGRSVANAIGRGLPA